MAVRGGEEKPRGVPSASRAPPPTPIATGKGLRSAAVDDRVLAEYLESSLRVPELALPESYFPAQSTLSAAPEEVELGSLLSKDEKAVRRVLESCKRSGAIRINGVEVVEAVREVFGLEEEKRWELGGWGEERKEFCWHRSARSETEKMLAEVWPGESYRTFRENMESFACKLEMVAECIAQILSENVNNKRHLRHIGKRESILCLRKYDIHRSREDQSDDAQDHHSHAMSIYLSGKDHEFFICSPERSASFILPTCSILVTIGKRLREWSNCEYQCTFGGPHLEESDNSNASFFIEFKCSPLALNCELDDKTKTISIMDQLLIVLALTVLYYLWTCISSTSLPRLGFF